MNIFDTYLQEIKSNVLTQIAKLAYDDNLTPKNLMEIPEMIIVEGGTRVRCCVYKERAIVNERVKMALGGNPSNPIMVEVINIACDECPVDGIQVTPACRGCIAHRCQAACPKDAIDIVDRKARIDKSKCIECGLCLKACQYSAIIKNTRPCVAACHAKAIQIEGETQKAVIDSEKCINCGACVFQCPFGAITDKSFITDAVKLILDSKNNTAYRVYAVIAPAIVSQYSAIPNVTEEKIFSAVRKLGFHQVVEAALGADIVAWNEAAELAEKGFVTTSCCPAFVSYVRKNHPAMEEHISHNLSPMAQIAQVIKEQDPGSKVIFIGPCIAKKDERTLPSVSPLIDCVLTFEELHALIRAKDIDLTLEADAPIEDASFFGRIFARSGGVATAVAEAIKEQGQDFEVKALSCQGIPEIRAAMLKAEKKQLEENLVEGMACEGGCIGGPVSFTQLNRGRIKVERFGQKAEDKKIGDSLKIYEKQPYKPIGAKTVEKE